MKSQIKVYGEDLQHKNIILENGSMSLPIRTRYIFVAFTRREKYSVHGWKKLGGRLFPGVILVFEGKFLHLEGNFHFVLYTKIMNYFGTI